MIVNTMIGSEIVEEPSIEECERRISVGEAEARDFVYSLLEYFPPLPDELKSKDDESASIDTQLYESLKFFCFIVPRLQQNIPIGTPQQELEKFWRNAWANFTNYDAPGIPTNYGNYLCRLAETVHTPQELDTIAVAVASSPEEDYSEKPDIIRRTIDAETHKVKAQYYRSLASIISDFRGDSDLYGSSEITEVSLVNEEVAILSQAAKAIRRIN